MRLAKELGHANVDAMLRGMTSRQLSEWMAYYSLEPFGEERADLRAGIITATMANAWRGKGRRARPTDFMPQFDRPAHKVQNVEEQKKQFAAFRRAVERKRGNRRKTEHNPEP